MVMEIGDKIIIRDLFGSLTQDNSVLQVLSKIGEAAVITGTGSGIKTKENSNGQYLNKLQKILLLNLSLL